MARVKDVRRCIAIKNGMIWHVVMVVFLYVITKELIIEIKRSEDDDDVDQKEKEDGKDERVVLEEVDRRENDVEINDDVEGRVVNDGIDGSVRVKSLMIMNAKNV